jgi:hypothetical protein
MAESNAMRPAQSAEVANAARRECGEGKRAERAPAV